ncbi:YbaB/EbfC family nucleoid-associated protein [Actinosynnema sp. NPDC023658]|uniref:YbaB/EbfC family nucleoid-associated protein n=1 Tax=Actinosynnema sp. NPDC023658 TaxID=3155465 RepID=UPI0033DECA62
MSGTFRFGFEEGDEGDRPPRPSPSEQQARQDSLTGQDADGVVTVAVNDLAEVQSVTITAQWRQSVDPRALGSAVTQAANAATMAALAEQVERPAEPAPQRPAPPPQPEERITPEQALRLMDAVSADLARFTQRMTEVVDRPLTVESRGGHVRGTIHRGQVLGLEADPAWTHSARVTEVQQEFLEVLRNLRARSVPSDLAQGPQSPAIAELTALVSDPGTLLRRVGLLP